MDTFTMLYCACFGGMFGAAFAILASRSHHKFNLSLLESYWNADIKDLRSQIEELEEKLSTETVDNYVYKLKNIDFSSINKK